MTVLKVIEIMAESNKGWEDAVEVAVEKAAKSVDNIRSVWIKDQSASVKDGKIVSYRVSCKISFKVGRS